MARRRKRKIGGGRKRIDVDRQPNGQPSRSKSTQAHRAYEVERRAISTALDARKRITGLPEEKAKTQEAGHVLGLLEFDGRIKPHEAKAGLQFGFDLFRYYRACSIPLPSAAAQNLFAVRGQAGDETLSQIERAKQSANHIQKVRQVILSCSEGRLVMDKLLAICFLDDHSARDWNAHTIGIARRGLDALATFYRIERDNDVEG